MAVHLTPMPEVNERGWETLVRELGVVDALRYINQFRTGGGDYTAEREKLFEGETAESIIAAIKARRGEEAGTSDGG